MRNNSCSSIATDSAERIDRYRYAYPNEACTYRQEGVRCLKEHGAAYTINRFFEHIRCKH